MTRPYDAVLFDFTGTLFWIEDAAAALAGSLGPGFGHWAARLTALGAINGSGTSPLLPQRLRDRWERRDLSREAHRGAHTGLSEYAGLSAQQAQRLYDRGVSPVAWTPYPDTAEVLRRLDELAVPTALVSNIGWEPRPVLRAYGVEDLLDVLVLSDERGVQKPDPEIFRMACADVGAEPRRTLMVGDNPDTDGAATRIGCAFALVAPVPPGARPRALLAAVGLE